MALSMHTASLTRAANRSYCIIYARLQDNCSVERVERKGISIHTYVVLKSTDSDNANHGLFRQVTFKVFGRSSFHWALLCTV